MNLARYHLYLTISGLGSLSQLIRLWSMSYYRFALNRKSYFADTVSNAKCITPNNQFVKRVLLRLNSTVLLCGHCKGNISNDIKGSI